MPLYEVITPKFITRDIPYQQGHLSRRRSSGYHKPWPLQAGQRQEKMQFERIRMIGAGAQGENWLMRANDNSLVVRKVFQVCPREGKKPLEVRILNEILPEHPSILSLYYWCPKPQEHKLHLYYEYCAGGSLDRLIPKTYSTPVPEGFIWHVFLQLAEALEVLHYLGTHRVVHRDVKLDNVFLSHPYDPTSSKRTYPGIRLGDFGLATLEPVTSGCGTYMWMGPEVPNHSAKGDDWSLGAIIHALAHGTGPIDRSMSHWSRKSSARKARSITSRYSKRLNDNMMHCLRYDPKDRVSSRDLVRNLRRDRP